jgi:hypothetical protein
MVLFLRYQVFRLPEPLEELLYGLTIIVPIIDMRRPMTFYEVDTASMFQSVVHGAFLEAIDGVTDLQGIPRLSEAERRPVLKDFVRT